MQVIEEHGKSSNTHGPTYHLDIEGTIHPWDEETITTEQIAASGGWAPALGVVQIDKDNNERTLTPGEVVQLKPGMGFSKKVRWKRGDFQQRVAKELALLQTRYPDSRLTDRWIRVPDYRLPPGWSADVTETVFFIRDGYPGISPYGIYVPAGLRFQNNTPANYAEPAANPPPFAGTWGFFSWEAEEWHATADPAKGHNLLNWVQGFASRFQQGV
jgi:hypothetical protein